VSLDDDIHVIVTVKGHFATVLLHENPSSSQWNANRHADKNDGRSRTESMLATA
jgi:hypothetical protein